MSRACAFVVFPDGVVRHGIYDGTSDILYPGLFDNEEAPWDHYYGPADAYDWAPEGQVFDAYAWNEYGSGAWWIVKATKNKILTNLSLFDDSFDDAAYHDPSREGIPDWLERARPGYSERWHKAWDRYNKGLGL